MYVLLFLSPPRTKKQRKEAALGACVINAIDGLLNYILMTSFLHLLRLSLEVLYTIISYNKNKKYLFRCLARIAFSSWSAFLIFTISLRITSSSLFALFWCSFSSRCNCFRASCSTVFFVILFKWDFSQAALLSFAFSFTYEHRFERRKNLKGNS